MRIFFALFFVMLSVVTFTSCDSGGSSSFSIVGSTEASGDSMVFRGFASTTPEGTPTSFKVRLYKAYISENEDCSDPVLLEDHGEEGQEFDFFDSPTLFSEAPAPGTYNCLILIADDTMKFKADSVAVDAHVGCENTTDEYTFDIYRAGGEDAGQ